MKKLLLLDQIIKILIVLKIMINYFLIIEMTGRMIYLRKYSIIWILIFYKKKLLLLS
jgi:hypothetical protein